MNDTPTHQSVQHHTFLPPIIHCRDTRRPRQQTQRPEHGRLNVQANRRTRCEISRKEGGRGARDRLLPFRESRARPCGAQAIVSGVAGRGPNQTHRGAGHTCSCPRRRRPLEMERMGVELASCAHKRGGIVRFAPRWWGQGGVSGASKGRGYMECSSWGSREQLT